jgi:energy-coupling factor transport system permease protein
VPVVIHAIIGSEDIIDAMDLRSFGIGPRTWLETLDRTRRDWTLIVIGIIILIASLAITILGYGNFWIPDAFIQLTTGG